VQSGVLIAFRKELLGDLKSAGAVGAYEPRQALLKVLGDAPFDLVPLSHGFAVVPRAAPRPNAAAPRIVEAAARHSEVQAEAVDAEPVAPSAVEEVVVSASRVARSGFAAPTPTSILASADIRRRAPVNIVDALNDLPTFRPSATSTSNVQSRTSRGQSFADLRGLGSVRTLVLVDGRRQPPTTPTGQVDLSSIPTLLVERTEVVTAGASAAWGSDAVAGVVNLVLRKTLSGVIADLGYGQTDKGDDQTWRFAAAAGAPFDDGRGHALVGVEYSQNAGTGDFYTRAWGREERGLVTNAAWRTNGEPALIYARGVRQATMTHGGLFTSGALRGTAFNTPGAFYTFNYGTVYGAQMIGGDGYSSTLGEGVPLKIPVKRTAAYAHLDDRILPRTTLFVDAATSVFSNIAPGAAHRDQGSLSISVDNAYLPAELRARLIAAGETGALLGRESRDLGSMIYSNLNQSYSVTGGLRGEFGASWRWEGYLQYGWNRYVQKLYRNRIEANWAHAIDAVVNPANGQIVCRSTLTNPTDGCQPFNLFGEGAFSPAAAAYVLGTSRYLQLTKQTSAAFNISGDPVSTWAGPVSVAGGLEYRKQSVGSSLDPLSRAGGFRIGNVDTIAGRVDVYEGFAEAVVPLLRDAPVARSFELNGAARFTRYSTSGGVATWKVGATWALNDQLRFRTTRSRDIRAPNLVELYTTASPAQATVRNPATGDQLQTRVDTIGNPALRPEKADTFTAGIVLTPSGVRGLRLSVDYYDIDIDGQISTIPTQTLVDRCFAGAADLCRYITQANGRISLVVSPRLNLDRFRTRGLDFEFDLDLPLASLARRLRGDLALRVLANHAIDLITVDSAGAVDRAGEVAGAGTPNWLVSATAGYTLKRLNLAAQWRWISGGTIESTAVAGTATGRNINTVPARLYTALSVQYDLKRSGGDRVVQLYAVADNLFDTQPPFPVGYSVVASGIYYDTIGRTFRGGVRLRY
jgi:outer membrane receptor protein involved in Fe transport